MRSSAKMHNEYIRSSISGGRIYPGLSYNRDYITHGTSRHTRLLDDRSRDNSCNFMPTDRCRMYHYHPWLRSGTSPECTRYHSIFVVRRKTRIEWHLAHLGQVSALSGLFTTRNWCEFERAKRTRDDVNLCFISSDKIRELFDNTCHATGRPERDPLASALSEILMKSTRCRVRNASLD